ncbi:MAG TPA: hypothetical protein VK034_29105 [Enhygromyxa sp.]|nr:hypothetical protein [Enhygromyxa sp.]
MQLTAILTTILQFFATSPDLCADVYVDANGDPYTDSIGQTLSRYCQWTGFEAPVLNSDVCCSIDHDGAACSLPDSNGRCQFGSRMFCRYGKATRLGVVCYQPFPSACRAGYCVQPPEVPPPTHANLACCNGSCFEIDPDSIPDCKGSGGTLLWCYDGVSNADGSITCFD